MDSVQRNPRIIGNPFEPPVAPTECVIPKYRLTEYGDCHSLCHKEQASLTSKIISILWKISDDSQTGKGTDRIVEFVRRLIFLQGFKTISSTLYIKALGHLADFLGEIQTHVENNFFLIESEAIKKLDYIVQQLLKGTFFIYRINDINTQQFHIQHNQQNALEALPALYIDIMDCITVFRTLKTPYMLQFVLSRFFERVFCRLPIMNKQHITAVSSSLSRTPSLFVCGIACILDFQKVPMSTLSLGITTATIRAVSETLWAFAPIIVNVIILHCATKGNELLWKCVISGLDPREHLNGFGGVRLLFTNTEEDLAYYLGHDWRSVRHTLGGFEDTTTRRYACDFGKSMYQHLIPSPLFLDDFWENAKTIREYQLSEQNKLIQSQQAEEEAAALRDPNVCLLSNPNHNSEMDKLQTKSKKNIHERKYAVSSTCYQCADTVPCSGNLLTGLEKVEKTIYKQLKLDPNISDSPTVDMEHYLRKAATYNAIGITSEHISPLTSVPTTIKTPSILSTANVFREPVKVCFWKGLGYSELYCPISDYTHEPPTE